MARDKIRFFKVVLYAAIPYEDEQEVPADAVADDIEKLLFDMDGAAKVGKVGFVDMHDTEWRDLCLAHDCKVQRVGQEWMDKQEYKKETF